MKTSRHAIHFVSNENENPEKQASRFFNFLKRHYGLLGVGIPLWREETMALNGELTNVGLYLVTVEPAMDDTAWGDAIHQWKTDFGQKNL